MYRGSFRLGVVLDALYMELQLQVKYGKMLTATSSIFHLLSPLQYSERLQELLY